MRSLFIQLFSTALRLIDIFSTTSQVKLLFVNAYVHKFVHTIICAMNKKTKIIFSQNYLMLFNQHAFPELLTRVL